MRRHASSPWGRRSLLLPLAAVVTVVLAGCAQESTLRPQGPGARHVEGLWWWLFWVSLAVWLVILGFVVWVLVRRRNPDVEIRGGDALGFVATAGIAVPLLILFVVYAISLRTQVSINRVAGGPDPVDVEVVGHQWWWEIRYPETGAVTANEMRIPVGRPIRVRLTTNDVLHSFWVPELWPKTDLISGQVRTTYLLAERAGRYMGQCAEFCGTQHTHMDFLVLAQPPAEYGAWLEGISRPARTPTTDLQRRGRQVFERSSCSACHSISGTAARGRVGPDLSTMGSRWSIGAGALPNTTENLGAWIADAQESKPGNEMPPQPMDPEDLRAVLAYLESLK